MPFFSGCPALRLQLLAYTKKNRRRLNPDIDKNTRTSIARSHGKRKGTSGVLRPITAHKPARPSYGQECTRTALHRGIP